MVVWIASLAILLTALVPLLSHAFVRDDANWVEICSATGARFIYVHADDKTPSAPKSPADHAFKHCAYCASHVTVLGLPPTLPSVSTPLLPVHDVPALFLQAARPLHAWTSAQPRAPPATC